MSAKHFRPLFLLLALAAGSGCLRSPFPEFSASIPENEEVNASLYAEELAAAKVREAREKKNLPGALSNALSYMSRSLGQDSTGALSFELGLTLREYAETPAFSAYYLSLDKSQRTLFKVFSNRESPGFSYSNAHLIALCDNRVNYELEKKVAALLWIPAFQKVSDEGDVKSNLALADFLSRRYPDTPGFARVLADASFFPPTNLSGKRLDAWSDAGKLASQCAVSNAPGEAWHAVSGAFAKARNRPHAVKSRIVATLAPWEEVVVLGFTDDDPLAMHGAAPEEKDLSTNAARSGNWPAPWARIRMGDGRLGFLESRWLGPVSDSSRDTLRFRKMARAYYQGDWLAAAEKTSAFLSSHPSRLWRERAIALLHAVHGQIALRASSRDNPYTRYALGHGGFFRYNESRKELAPSDLLVRHLLKVNPDSAWAYSLEVR